MNTKFVLFGLGLMSSVSLFGQFNINIKVEGGDPGTEAYINTLGGSKDILFKKEKLNTKGLNVKYPKKYMGMMKVYFPDLNYAVNFISENKDVNLVVTLANNKVSNVAYLDDSNRVMNNLQDTERKKEYILPALYQIAEYYKGNSDFSTALNKEINVLSSNNKEDLQNYPFINYYQTNYGKYVQQSAGNAVSQEDLIHFFANSNELLETSSLMRPMLLSFINTTKGGSPEAAVGKLLTAVNLETSRGQNILSELIEIFDAYGMTDLKNRYLNEAKSLKCEINDRLSNIIKTNDNVQIGATFANADLLNVTNSTAKTLFDVKAKKKIIVFWSSGCSHCETELPQFIPHYQELKKQNIEIIGFSLDSEESNYKAKANNYPWISSSELKGWNSSYVEKYNVHATPFYYVLDEYNKIIAKPDHFRDVISFLGVK